MKPYRVVGLCSLNQDLWNEVCLRDPGCSRDWSADDNVRPTKDWVRGHVDRERPLPNGITGHKVQLDKNTLKWRSWSSQTAASSPGNHVPDGNTFDQPLHKLTANEYRKLTEQVRDVQSAPVTRYRHSLKGTPNRTRAAESGSRTAESGSRTGYPGVAGDSVSRVYRSQLAASLKAFQNKQWTPYQGHHPGPDPAMPPRSRPPSSLSDYRQTNSRPGSSHPGSSRPGSSHPGSSHPQRPPSGRRPDSTPPDVDTTLTVQTAPLRVRTPGYDTLTPDLVYQLSDVTGEAGVRVESVYGDRPQSAVGPRETTDSPDTEDQPDIDGNPLTASDPGDSGGPRGESDSDCQTDLDTEEEGDTDPPDMARAPPELCLRPEQVDSLDTPLYARGDRRKYDFDASVVEETPCEFPYPLPAELAEVDLREVSLSDTWREQVPAEALADPTVDYLVRRMVEFERLQSKTEEWERARNDRHRSARQRQTRSKVYPLSRVQSARTWRERRCCGDCMQLACVGDCPTKPPSTSSACAVCGEAGCSGSCGESGVYDSRSRAEAEEERPPDRPRPTRPRSCTSCQTRHTGRVINAHQVALGRPRSGHATFTRGQQSARPRNSTVDAELTPDMEQLRLTADTQPTTDTQPTDDTNSRPSTASRRRHTGRAAVLPGKSYFSQRRLSLTERELVADKRTTTVRRLRGSARLRRPKTAA